MKSTLAALGAGLVMIALAIGLGVRAYRATYRTPAVSAASCPANAKKANLDFTLNDTAGHPVRLSDYAGKVVVLDFWATWCVPCQVELPGFVRLHEKYKDRGADVVGIVVMDEFKNAAPFAAANGMTYPILDGVDRADIEAAFGPLMGLPTSFVIGRDGRICAAHLGIPEITKPAPTLQQSIENVFDGEIQALL